ncbi:MAG: hypothetical protein QOC83_3967 [Pseudonocardiales bacterium]|jgi:hypothetical protein|nr:hypothetical protein [Pseudonocardiales bacterium]MDT7621147.1 hypothetical protein [Pseudonocardiales bacterium]MDT7639679.1 hypothetical protein [Pseudonocardiales bacterium]
MKILARLIALSPLPMLTAFVPRPGAAPTPQRGQQAPAATRLGVETEITRQLMAGEINQGTYRFLIETLAAHESAQPASGPGRP